MRLNKNNYFSLEAAREYFSVSQYKNFLKCEAATMAEIRGEYTPPQTTALLVGSYVDAYFEGTLDKFIEQHPEILKRDGTLKADYAQANDIIKRCESDEVFMQYMSGKKQVIKSAELFGAKWKIKIDSYFPGKLINDLKVMRSLERIMGVSFVEHWQYDTQMAVYAEVEKIAMKRETPLPTTLSVVTKEVPSDIEIIDVPEWRRTECLAEVKKNMPHLIAVKTGKIQPERCGACPYCRQTKKCGKPLDFQLVGFTNKERQGMME